MFYLNTTDVVDRIEKHFVGRRYPQCLELARQTKATMLEQPIADPHMLGWVRYYEFKALYQLQRFQEAYDLFNTPEPQPYLLHTKNAAWMHSVAAELAARLNRPDEVVKWGGKCLDMRLSEPNEIDAMYCCLSVCTLLHSVGRDDLNERFARHCITWGTQTVVKGGSLHVAANHAILSGYAFLVRNAQLTQDPVLIEFIVEGKQIIEGMPARFTSKGAPVLSLIKELLDELRPPDED